VWLHSRHGFVQWLTAHEASTEHDVAAGLRENFDAKKRWRSAIASARALHRFGKHSRASSASSSGSGGWGRDHVHSESEAISEAPSHDESTTDASESFTKLSLGSSDPGTNVKVKITGPEEGEAEETGKEEGSSSVDDPLTGGNEAGLKDETDSNLLNVQASSRAGPSLSQLVKSEAKRTELVPVDTPHSETGSHESDLSELRMPGTFHFSKGEERSGSPIKWSETFRKFGLFRA